MSDKILTLTEQEAGLLVHALAELPAKVSMSLIIKIRTQLVAQSQDGAGDTDTAKNTAKKKGK